MKFIADFHIHSRYSYATSKTMDLQALAVWGQLKGIGLMGTGDFTHPVWKKELHEQLESLGNGLFVLKKTLQEHVQSQVYDSCVAEQVFMVTAEISTIFRRHGRVYKTHSLIFAPSLEIADSIAQKLAMCGNIAYDGRPVLSLDVKDLLKMVLDISSDCMVVPAHIWTPHFGLLGSQSGFDSFYDCFEEMTDYIYAFEKGLSSNFLLNAQVSSLDRFAILCNSDAHSVQNLGREANVFDTELSYDAIVQALQKNDKNQLLAGIEFFPEMGKYFATGHRNCGVVLLPEDVLGDRVCSVCHKPLTIGVADRIKQLADRTVQQAEQYKRRCYRIAPLQDIIAYVLQVSVSSKKVQKMYHQMLQLIGHEFYILLDASIDVIAQSSSLEIAQAIFAVRSGKVFIDAGYDGLYGSIRL